MGGDTLEIAHDPIKELVGTVSADHFCCATKGMGLFHKHTYYEMSLILRGHVRVTNNSDVFECVCPSPTIFLHFPGTFHCVEVDPGHMYERYNVSFSPKVFRLCPMLLEDAERVFVSNVSMIKPTREEADELIYYITPCIAKGTEEEGLEKRVRLLSIILNIVKHCEDFGSTFGKHPSSDCVNRAVGCIAQKLSPSTTANDLAAELNVSRAKLTADFKRETGMTLKEYIELQCVERAKSTLATGKSVQLAADELGFVDVGTFIRMFKKVTGETPGKYRMRTEVVM